MYSLELFFTSSRHLPASSWQRVATVRIIIVTNHNYCPFFYSKYVLNLHHGFNNDVDELIIVMMMMIMMVVMVVVVTVDEDGHGSDDEGDESADSDSDSGDDNKDENYYDNDENDDEDLVRVLMGD